MDYNLFKDDEFLTLPQTVTVELCKKLRSELDSIRNPVDANRIKITSSSPEFKLNTPSTPISQQSAKTSTQPQSGANLLAPITSREVFDTTPVMQQCKTTLVNNNQAAPAAQRVKKRSFAVRILY